MAGSEKSWDRKVILMKIEPVEGTDAAPTEAANAFQVLNYAPNFMDADGKVRNLDKAFFGANPVLLAGFKRGARFDMEMTGGGNAAGTTVPPWMTIARIAGNNAGVVTGGNSVVQSPITDLIPSATHWSYIDDLLLKAIGGRAAMGFRIEDDDFPMFNFAYMGRPPASLADQLVPANPTIAGYPAPLLASSENTTFTWDGFAAPLRRWEMNNNADLQLRSLIGPADKIAFRNRAWNGTIVIQIPDLTTKNYFTAIRPGTTGAARAVHGTAAGNIVDINAPALQMTGNVEISEEGGKAMASFPVTALPVTGNDEFTFTSK